MIDAPGDKSELIIGVSRAMDKTRKVIVGFTTLFKHNGDFIFFYSKAPVSTWDEYEGNLEEMVTEAIEEYQKKETLPGTLIFHFHKRTGKKETEAIQRALTNLGISSPYALLHLNSSSNYRLFDTSDTSHVPQSGLFVRLGRRQGLLLTDGRRMVGGRAAIGTPRVFEITLDKGSTLDVREFPRLVEQVYRFASINWRGLNAKSVPVTINYSYLIAKLIGTLDSVDTWNSIVTNGKLSDKAWFL